MTCTVNGSVAEVVVVVEVVVVAGDLLVLVGDVAVVLADFPPPHAVPVAASPRHAIARHSPRMYRACPRLIEWPRGFGRFISSPLGLCPGGVRENDIRSGTRESARLADAWTRLAVPSPVEGGPQEPGPQFDEHPATLTTLPSGVPDRRTNEQGVHYTGWSAG